MGVKRNRRNKIQKARKNWRSIYLSRWLAKFVFLSQICRCNRSNFEVGLLTRFLSEELNKARYLMWVCSVTWAPSLTDLPTLQASLLETMDGILRDYLSTPRHTLEIGNLS